MQVKMERRHPLRAHPWYFFVSGSALLVLGVTLSAVSQANAQSSGQSSYMVYWGAIVAGLVIAACGLMSGLKHWVQYR
jgi:hypothetical protein